jgi:hypothetical protein
MIRLEASGTTTPVDHPCTLRQPATSSLPDIPCVDLGVAESLLVGNSPASTLTGGPRPFCCRAA